MKKDKLVAQFTSEHYKTICKRIAGDSFLGDDLYQEAMLCILELPVARLNEIAKSNNGAGLPLFFFGIAYRMRWGKKTNFYRIFIKKKKIDIYQFKNQYAGTDKEKFEKDLEFVLSELKKIKQDYAGEFPYDVKMLESYIALGSFAKIEQATGISDSHCYRSINNLRTKIKANAKRRGIDIG